MRLIDADRLLTERMKSMYYHLPNGDIAIPIIDIEHAPTIEPKQGEWIIEFDGWKNIRCSECGWEKNVDIHVSFGYNFCPNCGAKMFEVEVE